LTLGHVHHVAEALTNGLRDARRDGDDRRRGDLKLLRDGGHARVGAAHAPQEDRELLLDGNGPRDVARKAEDVVRDDLVEHEVENVLRHAEVHAPVLLVEAQRTLHPPVRALRVFIVVVVVIVRRRGDNVEHAVVVVVKGLREGGAHARNVRRARRQSARAHAQRTSKIVGGTAIGAMGGGDAASAATAAATAARTARVAAAIALQAPRHTARHQHSPGRPPSR